jgi:plasmid stability protein
MAPEWSRFGVTDGQDPSIKNAPDDVVEKLKKRAEQNDRSLQGELLAIVTEAVSPKRLTVMEVYERGKAMGLKTKGDSVKIIRAMRDGR